MMPSSAVSRPVTMYISPMPRPGPVPITDPTDPASRPPSARSGSKTLSASGPARRIASGEMPWEIMRRIAKTRPCTAGGTFDCHSTWLAALATGTALIMMKAAIPTTITEGLSPARATPRPATKIAIMVPRTLRFGPPQALTSTLPPIIPNPATDNTEPAAPSEAKARIRGKINTFPKERVKLTPA